ncbi:hypothetical protein [Nocardioides montaniterrae]
MADLDWDPAVGEVEALLPPPAVLPGEIPIALWLCACVSERDAPTWLIHESVDGVVGWCRLADELRVADVGARELIGGHGVPWQVLSWLQGNDPDPCWDIEGERRTTARLRAALLGSP